MSKVFISSGHSANDPGAVKYVVERDEVWKIANYVAEILNNKYLGVTAYRDAWRDGWRDTVDKANRYDCDYFFEFHENAGGGDGAECIIHNSSNQWMANEIERAFTDVGQNWRRTIIDPTFWVLKYTDMPAMIVECAFVDNWNDIKDWDDDKEKYKMAESLAKHIAKICGAKLKPIPKPPKPTFYFVKKKWADDNTNKFSSEKQAIDYAMDKTGYSVFTDKGKEVWRNNMNDINKTVDFKVLEAIKSKKVWGNPDYKKEFIAQKINLNFENAEKVLIEFSPSKGGDTTEYKVVDLNKSSYLQHIAQSDLNKVPELRARRVTATKDGIVFGKGYGRSITNSKNYERNDYNIPVAVYLLNGFN